MASLRDFVIFTIDMIFLNFLWFEFITQSTERKFLPGIHRVLNYSYSKFYCNPSTHSQIKLHIVNVVLSVALIVDCKIHIILSQ